MTDCQSVLQVQDLLASGLKILITDGNALLLACAALVAKQTAWTFSIADAAYWAVVLLMLAARFVDISRFHGETTDGKPATMAHFKRYAALLALIAGTVWALAHAVTL